MMQPRIVAGLTFALLITLITPCLACGETIGAPLVHRTITDTAAGSIFALNSGFAESGRLTDWAFYNDDTSQIGLVVTPLLLDVVGGNYVITGVGTPHANLATGVQSFSFELTSGSDTVSPGSLFGWKDGTDADRSHTGVIQFDFVGSPVAGTQQWFFYGHAGDLFPGSNLGGGFLLGTDVDQPDRDYSVQATVVSEPTSVTLWGFGLLALLAYSWRHTRAGTAGP